MVNLAIVGATGLVGSMFLKVLEEKNNIKIDNLYLFATKKSAGKTILFRGKKYVVEELCEDNVKNKKIDYALFSAGGETSKQYAKMFVNLGCLVIDNSSAWRMDKEVPLAVPQVNFASIKKQTKLIANPNCSTIQCMELLDLINKKYKLKAINFVTFQAVSGSGKKGIDDLERSRNGENCVFYPYNISQNCLPHIGDFLKNEYSTEEMKMVNETKKILNLKNVAISATCVRVPVKNSHSIYIEAECEKTVNVNQIRNMISSAKSLVLQDDVQNNLYPLASVANGTDKIYVGRIRKDLNRKNIVHMFCVADNLRKGAASNAIEILEKIMKSNL